MPIKTAAEMFGDDAGFGLMVPVSVTNPAGTGTGNRGIAFGEPLTSAIANRSHYALALNDEDLDSRLAPFEVGGLDGAYDNGLVGPAGAGRVVTKDAGAVEAASGHSGNAGDTIGDNALFRANTLGDTAANGVGFEHVGKLSSVDGLTGHRAVAGFLDRQALAWSTGDTVLQYEQGAVLNPGGGLPSTVRLTTASRKFHTSTASRLTPGYAIVEVKGGGAENGLYILANFGTDDTDALVMHLNGGSVTFGANIACTVSVYLPLFAAGGGTSSPLVGNLMLGLPNQPYTLRIMPGGDGLDPDNTAAGVANGSVHALSVFRRISAGGSIGLTGQIDQNGRFWSVAGRGFLISEYERNYETRAGFRSDVSVAGDIGFLSSQLVSVPGLTNHGTVQTLVEASATPSPALTHSGVEVTFSADSPTSGVLMFSALQDDDLIQLITPHAALVHLLRNDAGSPNTNGLFMVTGTVISGNRGLRVRKLDGSLPAHFPTSGTAQCYIHSAQYTASRYSHAAWTFAAGGFPASETVSTRNRFSAGMDALGTAVAAYAPGRGLTGRALFRGFSTESGAAAPGNVTEEFFVGSDGAVRARTGYTAGDAQGLLACSGFTIADPDEGDFTFGTARTRVTTLTSHQAQLSPGWLFGISGAVVTDAWTSPRPSMIFDLSAVLPHGAVVSSVRVHWDPGDAVATSADRMQMAVVTRTNDISIPSASTTINGTETDNGTSSNQVRAITGLSVTVNKSGSTPGSRTLPMVIITASAVAPVTPDAVWSIEVTWTDPGPRNY